MELLIKALIISLFCVGLRIVSSKGMILHFLRMPYEVLIDWRGTHQYMLNNKLIHSTLIYILKPIIGCGTCMASVWTIVIDLTYYNQLDKYTILLIFVVAALNSLLFAAYEKLSK